MSAGIDSSTFATLGANDCDNRRMNGCRDGWKGRRMDEHHTFSGDVGGKIIRCNYLFMAELSRTVY